MAVGQKQRLAVETNIRKLKWKSSNPKVAAVLPSGRIHAKKAGTAQITAYYGKLKAVCKVRVRRKRGRRAWKIRAGSQRRQHRFHNRDSKTDGHVYWRCIRTTAV